MGKSKEKKPSSRPSKRWEAYDNAGKKTKKECPQCGRGIFMGYHKSPERYHCGKCSYVEYISAS